MANRTLPDIINPCTGAVTLGLLAAISTAFGSAALFHQKNLAANTLTTLTGGTVNGAIVGSIGCFLPLSQDPVADGAAIAHSLSFNVGDIAMSALMIFFLVGFFTAPFMGKAMLGYSPVSEEVIDQQILGAIILSISCIAATRLAANIGCRRCKVSDCCSTLFSRSTPDASLTVSLSADPTNNL